MIRRLLKWVVAPILILLLLLSLLIFTQWGNRLLVAGVNTLSFIDIQFRQGHLLNQAEFEQIQIELDGLSIVLDEVSYHLHKRCLLVKRLCLPSLQADSVRVVMSPTEKVPEPEPEPLPPALIDIPIDISIDTIEVKHIAFENPGVAVAIEELTSAVAVQQSQVNLASTSLSRVEVKTLTATDQVSDKATASESNDKQASTADSENDWPLAALPEIFLPVELLVAQVSIADIMLWLNTSSQPQPDVAIQDFVLALNWSGYQLDITELDLQARDYGHADLTGNIDWQTPWGVNLQANTEISHFPWYEELENSKQTLQVKGNLAELEVILLNAGNVPVSLDVRGNLLDSKLPFVANLQSQRIDLTTLLGQPLIINNSQSQVYGDLQQQQFNTEIKLNGFGYQQAKVNVTGTHSEQVVDLTKLNFVDAATKSSLSGQVSLDYSSDFSSKADINIPSFQLPQIMVNKQTIDGRIEGQLHLFAMLDKDDLPKSLEQPGTWQVSSYNSRLKGLVNEQPIALNANFSIDNELRLEDGRLMVSVAESELNISGYSDENWHLKGQWQGVRLQRWLEQIEGQLAGDIQVNGEIRDPQIELLARLQEFSMQTIQVPEALLTLNYRPISNHQADIEVKSAALQIQEKQVSDISLKVNGDLDKQTLQLNTSGDIPVLLALDNQLDLEAQRSQLQVNSASVGFEGIDWQLQQALLAQIDMQDPNVEIEPHCWQHNDNQICVTQQSQLGNDGDLYLNWFVALDDYDELMLGKVLELKSAINGDAQVSWSAGQLAKLSVVNHLQGGQLTLISEDKTADLIRWQQGKVEVTGNAERLKVDLFVDKDAGSRLLAGDLEVDLQQASYPISGKLDIERFRIQLLEELVPGISKARGDISSALVIAGTAEKPALTGRLSLHDGEFETYQSPNSIDNINIDANFTGQQADIDGGFKIRSFPAELSATVDWQQGLVANARLFAEKIPLLYPPNLDAVIGTDIRFAFAEQEGQISGEIQVLDGLMTLEDLPEGSIDVSDDAVIVDASGEEVEQKSRFAIATDVDLLINPEFRLKGQGFTGNLGGKLKIRQKAHQPLQLFGLLKILNGEYKAYGQDLKVDSGEISFAGSPSNPNINVKAIREIKDENVVVGLSIVGPTEALNLSFFSNPGMAQPEIMSYLIRGRGLDANSGGGSAVGVALANALTKTTPIQNVVQNLPLLSDVTIDAEVEDDVTQATISGYLGERIFLKYGIGVYEPINELTVRFYLMSRLWLETVSGLENSADIYYSFEID
ncbi:translocation/assembly module TamB domain-containing protein [Thalassotalea mangrovi]|uniref:Translocation and assembly module TamB C-terminal domain-containing protein n=1 Tax=Thalassotalea mangrovi TaxID=2572245 RepID=A0A4U1B7Q4_9GAMM|nr:translocation/assembly module TamB domain-containing protein [Thalassotalea mangrovi]TKB46272.1 hypothetical protein E8M12_04260 [Thalassotalea mangrovi]